MTVFRPPDHLIAHETDHWLINHRVDSKLPGYFMVASKVDTNDLSDLPIKGLQELGAHLANLQRIISELLSPIHFYIGRFGHKAGHAIHFHVIPVCDWVARAFEQDERYKALSQFCTPGESGNETMSGFDGAEMTLFIWREFCESRNPPEILGPSVQETVEEVRKLIGDPVASGDSLIQP